MQTREMVHRSLHEIIQGRLIEPVATICATMDESVLAIDVVDAWSAIFQFSVQPNGDWYAGCQKARAGVNGRWEDAGSGGFRGTGWELRWKPPNEGWDGDGLLVFGTIGHDVEDHEEHLSPLPAFVGFAASPVAKIQLVCGANERLIPVDSAVGGFVVIAIGFGDVRLQALGVSGRPVGNQYQYRPIRH